jgi:hypothetical protein
VTSANHIGSREEPQPEPHHVSVDAIVDSASVHYLRKMQGLARRLWGQANHERCQVHSRTRQPTVSLAPRATTAPRDELHRVIEQLPDDRLTAAGGIFARAASLPGRRRSARWRAGAGRGPG